MLTPSTSEAEDRSCPSTISRANFAWAGKLLAVAGVLLVTREWAAVLAVFPLYFALQIAWSQYWLARSRRDSEAGTVQQH